MPERDGKYVSFFLEAKHVRALIELGQIYGWGKMELDVPLVQTLMHKVIEHEYYNAVGGDALTEVK